MCYNKKKQEKEEKSMEKYVLTGEGIALAVNEIGDFLEKNKAFHRQTVSIRLTAEETLLKYMEDPESPKEFELSLVKIFGKLKIVIRLHGKSFDPFSDIPEEEAFLQQTLANIGQAPSYSFRHGANIVAFTAESQKKLSSIGQILLAVALGLLLGFPARFLPGSAAVVYGDFLSPVLTAIMGFITTLSLFLIFFSVVSGVCNMGDIGTFRKVGKRIAAHSARLHLPCLLLAVGCSLLAFSVGGEEGGGIDLASIWKMIVDMVPTNIVGAFVEGKALQIIFLAVVSGVMLLVLSEKVQSVVDLVNQLDHFVLSLMQEAVRFMPVVVFISIFNMAANSDFSSVVTIYKYPLLDIGCSLLASIGCLLWSSVRQKVRFPVLLKKVLPTYMLALTTSSASASFTQSMKDCDKEFGIHKKLTNVGIPLGQMLFRPNMGFQLLFGCLALSAIYGVPITTPDFVTAALSALLLAIAAPPVAGSSVACFEIMFLQLGIPMEAISLILALNVIITPLNIATQYLCLETKMIETASDLEMIDRDVLRRGKT